jgi:hypothetical protein
MLSATRLVRRVDSNSDRIDFGRFRPQCPNPGEQARSIVAGWDDPQMASPGRQRGLSRRCVTSWPTIPNAR